MGANYRCSLRDKCGARRTLKHLIDWYRTRPLCLSCKKDTLKPVSDKEYERSKKRGCFCRGNGWPHNRGYIVDEFLTCIHATDEAMSNAVFDKIALDMGGQIIEMGKTEKCPF